jgi:YHS domain-containing protein
MNNKIIALRVVLCAGLIIAGLAGCGEDAPPASETDKAPETKTVTVEPAKPDPARNAETVEEILNKAGNDIPPEIAAALKKLAAEGRLSPGQTTCPVMEGEIKEDISVDYKGQKVYFCCPPCKDKFNADPEKYLPKLPQFKK